MKIEKPIYGVIAKQYRAGNIDTPMVFLIHADTPAEAITKAALKEMWLYDIAATKLGYECCAEFAERMAVWNVERTAVVEVAV